MWVAVGIVHRVHYKPIPNPIWKYRKCNEYIAYYEDDKPLFIRSERNDFWPEMEIQYFLHAEGIELLKIEDFKTDEKTM